MSHRRPLYFSRRRRRLRLRLTLLGLALVAVAVVVAVTAPGLGPHGPSPALARRPGPTVLVGAAPASRPLRPGPGADGAQAIDRVLRNTPLTVSGGRGRRLIALTFDDGPSPYTLPAVRVLRRMRVPATFFVVGQQLRYFSTALRDALRRGFDIGDHTQNHAWLARLDARAQLTQVRAAATGVQRLGGPFPRLFRPPYGVYDRRTLSVLRSLRMLMVLWSVDPGDWRRPGAKAIASRVFAHAMPGAIVILHDGGGDRSQTVAALPAIIRGLRRRGYGLVSVPQLLALDPPARHQRLPPMTGA